MKKILFIAAILCNTLAFAQADPTASPTDCTNAFFKGMLDEDAAPIEKVTAADFLIISFDGTIAEKDLVLQGVGGGFVLIETGVVSGLRVRTYGDNAAVVTGSWKAKGAIQGNNFDNEIIFGTTCIKTAGSWKMVSMQFTAPR